MDISTDTLLSLFSRMGAKVTFFAVGSCAASHGKLVHEILSEGHEVACHTAFHQRVDHFTPDLFRDDLHRNIDLLMDAGANRPVGFRAPQLSLTKRCRWAWDILSEMGFSYSSSVPSASSPLFATSNLLRSPQRVRESLWEIPVSTGVIGPLGVPFASGLYMRLIPSPLFRWFQDRSQGPLVAYAHPYDYDVEQPFFLMNLNPLYNGLLFMRRSVALSRLEALLSTYQTSRYDAYVGTLNGNNGRP